MNREPKIRHAKIDDLPSIVEIYNQAIRSCSATGDMKEFTVEQRLNWFNKFTADSFPIYVAEINNQIVGYATLSPYRPGRQAMNKVAEISFFLDYSFHGMGLGSLLLNYVINDCKRLGKLTLLSFLLDINSESVLLLKKFKFEEWGKFPNIINFDDFSCGHLVYGLKLSQ
jgi:phosphinothricin acetyltransferase